MHIHTLFGKLFLGTASLIVLALGICAWLVVVKVDALVVAEQAESLCAHGAMIATVLGDRIDAAHADELRGIVRRLAAQMRGERITLIAPSGVVLADSEADAKQMEPHGDRPEVKEALEHGHGESTRYSATVAKNMKYVAVRAGPAEAPRAVVRVAMPLANITEQKGAVARIVGLIAVLGAASAAVFALGLARLWSLPLRRITATARSLSRGDLTARARIGGSDELAVLARSLNEMRDHLAGQMATIDRQRRTLEALLEQLHEGVVVVGPDRKVLLMNPTAAEMLGTGVEETGRPAVWTGMPVEYCVGHPAVQRLLLGESPAGEPTGVQETQIQLRRGGKTVNLLAHVSDLVLPNGGAADAGAGEARHDGTGRLLVLTDVTELAHAVQVKSDFAANASHELRTPLAAIRAAVETLMGMELPGKAAEARPFLEMIDRHSSRMEQMVFDLLSLSRIESSPGQFKVERIEPGPLLAELHSRYASRIEAKGLEWSARVRPGLGAICANRELLRLALDNLIDNAVKFTDAGRISVEAAAEGGSVTITVSDTGCGISEAEQERVFERFYQVERARSGPNRGTGLGLAIVRHAVAAMHGRVTLESRLGEGTRITISIPESSTEQGDQS